MSSDLTRVAAVPDSSVLGGNAVVFALPRATDSGSFVKSKLLRAFGLHDQPQNDISVTIRNIQHHPSYT